MDYFQEDRKWFVTLLVVLFLLLAALLTRNSLLALFFITGFFLALLMLRCTEFSFIAAIVVMPLAATGFFNMQIMGIPGFKPANIIILLFFASFILSKQKYDIPEKIDVLFFAVYSVAFFVAVLRSTSFIPDFYNYFWTGTYTTVKYFLSFGLIPYLFSLSFLSILVFMRTDRDLKLFIQAVYISMFVLSATIIYIYLFLVPDKAEFQTVRVFIGDMLGLHGNEVSGAYIILFPTLLIFAIKEMSWFRIMTVIMGLFCVMVLYSRTAYLLVFISSLIIVLMLQKIWPIIVFGLMLWLSINFIPGSIVNRAMTGLYEGDIAIISAGRVNDIWMPIMRDIEQDPLIVLFGYGRFGIIDTPSFKTGEMARFNTSHNIFLDMVLDAGIFILAVFLAFYGRCIVNSGRIYRRSANPLLKNLALGVLAGLICFIIDGFTGGSFFPKTNNYFIWLLLGAACALQYRDQEDTAAEKTVSWTDPVIRKGIQAE